MVLFHNDYNECCHPAILERLNVSAQDQMSGYGEDPVCERAADLIRKECKNDNLSVHFLVGGTQTNLTVIAAALRPHQAVIGAVSAHINVHETGAIEATGHKVIALPSEDGKVIAPEAEKVVLSQKLSMDAEHIAQPKMIYISNPTEYGTCYTLAELEELSALCKRHNLKLYVDGARMGYALAAKNNDITLADYARLCSAFYIGGTKVGAMFGEAVVISDPDIAEDFRYIIKQRGAMLAKGWLLGIQFETLFTDKLYYKISAHADQMADKLRDAIRDLGYPLYLENASNQVFAILPNELLDQLGKQFTYATWESFDDTHTIVRFCTSWATREEDVSALCAELRRLTER